MGEHEGEPWGKATNKIIFFDRDARAYYDKAVKKETVKNEAIVETIIYTVARDNGWSIFRFLRTILSFRGRIRHPENGPENY